MNKKGFVFVESIVVLVVVALSLAMLISSYSLVTRKTKEKEYYNKASDKYLLYSLSNIGTDDTCNYSMDCGDRGESSATFKGGRVTFRADADATSKYSCDLTKVGKIIYDCNKVFEDMNLVHLYAVNNILTELNNTNSVSFFDSGTLEYMKSLKKCNDPNFNTRSTTCSDEFAISYLIGVFDRGNGEYHYASIEIETTATPENATVLNEANGWHCENCGGSTLPANQRWYYTFNDNRLTGLQYLPLSSGNDYYWFYLDYEGIMKTGWITIDGNKSCFISTDPDNNGVLNGHRIDSSTLKIDGATYSFNVDGVCVEGPCDTAEGIPTSIDYLNRVPYSG